MSTKKILVAIDYHSASVNAFHYAQQIAVQEKAELILLHVFHVPVPAMDSAIPIHDIKEVQSFENKRMERFQHTNTEDTKTKIKISRHAVEGLAGDIIPEWIKKNKPNLVVMGIHETNVLDEFLMGSTCEKIIYDDLVPVLIVPGKAKYKKVHHITLATDLKDINVRHVADVVKHYCSLFNAKLQLLHITQPNEIKFLEINRNLEKLEEELSQIKHSLNEPESSSIHDTMEKELLRNRSQWLMLIHKKYSFLKEIFHRSLIKKMTFHSEIPILILNSGNKPGK